MDSEALWPRGATRPWRTVTANAYVSYRSIRRWLAEEIAHAPMDPLCAILLRRLSQTGGRELMGLLARELALPPSTMSSAARRLERNGLAERYLDSLDRRCRVIGLTAAGEAHARQVTPGIDAIEQAARTAVGDQGRMGFNLMANILGAIDEEPDPWA